MIRVNGNEKTSFYGNVGSDNNINTNNNSAIPGAQGKDADSIPNLHGNGLSFNSSDLGSSMVAMASAGATILALISQTLAEQVRENRNMTYEAQMQSADLMEKQASEMRKQATIKFACSIVSNVISLASSGIQMGMSIKIAGNSALSDAQKMAQSAAVTAFEQATKSVTGFIQAGGEYGAALVDSGLKELEADQKKIDAFADQVKSITESLQSVVQRSIDTSSTISQGMIEANKRILG